MVTRKPYAARLLVRYTKTSWCASLLMSLGLLVTVSSWQKTGEYASLSPSSGNSFPVSYIALQPTEKSIVEPLLTDLGLQGRMLPNILTEKDIETYKAIFAAQQSGNWNDARALIGDLDNTILVGHVLAKHYLSSSHPSTAQELSEWLANYSDHPQAPAIYNLALAKSPAIKEQLPVVRRQNSLSGYGDDNGLAVLGADAPYTQTWNAGLSAFRAGRMEEAAKFFSTIAKRRDDISPWMYSAASFWAHRAYNAAGDKAEASRYLEMAAENPRSFYGIIARKQLHRGLELDASPVKLTETDVLEMIGDPSVRRTIALSQIDMTDLAENELRARFPQADGVEKPRLLALAHELNLAAVQISMARQLRDKDSSLDFARYPIPNWEPQGGFFIDPALIFAMMRQESGFRISAVSPQGALGLMQLMPQTASLMQKRITLNGEIDIDHKSSAAEPVMNITLGQNYIQHLMETKMIEGNLFYLLASYNAGPGRLQDWKKSLDYNDDPLLFVESIPFAETRNYVMQVMTNYWIYSELTGKANYSVYALLHGNWPWYEPYTGPVASRSVPKVTASNKTEG